MTLCELATAVRLQLPIIVVVLDNKYLGMVRQWQHLFYENRLSGVDLVGNPDFVAVAEAYGAKGLRLSSPADIDEVIAAALEHRGGPVLIHAEVIKHENVYPMIPAGARLEDMLLGPTSEHLEKPQGST